jgi:hypothetical protein
MLASIELDNEDPRIKFIDEHADKLAEQIYDVLKSYCLLSLTDDAGAFNLIVEATARIADHIADSGLPEFREALVARLS